MTHRWHVMTVDELPHYTAWCGHLVDACERCVWFYDDNGQFDSDACQSCAEFAIAQEQSKEHGT